MEQPSLIAHRPVTSRRLLAASLATVVLLLACGANSEDGGSSRAEPKRPKSSPVRVVERHCANVVNGTIRVSAGSHVAYWVNVSESMNNARLVGEFRAYGGSGNDIIVLVMSKMDYINYSNGHRASVFYHSEQTTFGQFDVRLSDAGTYGVLSMTTTSRFCHQRTLPHALT